MGDILWRKSPFFQLFYCPVFICHFCDKRGIGRQKFYRWLLSGIKKDKTFFVFDKIAPDLSAITLMVQLSGIVATVATLVAGALSDKIGNRRSKAFTSSRDKE